MAFFRKKKEIPHGLWMKCQECGKTVFTKAVAENQNVCPECGFHHKLSADARVKLLIDEGTFEQLGEDVEPKDRLRFIDKEPYEDKLKKTQTKTERTEAAICGVGKIKGREVSLCCMDFQFMGGSMGVVVGERVAMAADAAREREIPLLVVATSGGARMHEGALSLMQMAKTSAAIARLREVNMPYLAILTDPCTGGVSASFAAQGDLTIAEPGALIGFAGPRVIEGTIKKTLPEGFQRAEFLLEHGYVDRIVKRHDMKDEVAKILNYLLPPIEGAETDEASEDTPPEAPDEPSPKSTKKAQAKKKPKKPKSTTKK